MSFGSVEDRAYTAGQCRNRLIQWSNTEQYICSATSATALCICTKELTKHFGYRRRTI